MRIMLVIGHLKIILPVLISLLKFDDNCKIFWEKDRSISKAMNLKDTVTFLNKENRIK